MLLQRLQRQPLSCSSSQLLLGCGCISLVPHHVCRVLTDCSQPMRSGQQLLRSCWCGSCLPSPEHEAAQ